MHKIGTKQLTAKPPYVLFGISVPGALELNAAGNSGVYRTMTFTYPREGKPAGTIFAKGDGWIAAVLDAVSQYRELRDTVNGRFKQHG